MAIFAIISIVIAVTGCTYTAVINLRKFYAGILESAKDCAASQMEEITDKSKEQYDRGLAVGARFFHFGLQVSLLVWALALPIPIVLFTIAGFSTGFHVWSLDWPSVGEIASNNNCDIYKLGLGIVLWADLSCVVLGALSVGTAVGCRIMVGSKYATYEAFAVKLEKARHCIPSDEVKAEASLATPQINGATIEPASVDDESK